MGTPSGTVTFLFTDIEGSTRLWQAAPEAMRSALARHDVILTTAVEGHGGYVFSSAGDGIAAAFQRSADGVAAAVDAQRALGAEVWPDGAVVRVRMGLHTGEADERDGNYFGTPLNRAARLMAAAHGGQVVVSDVTAGVLAGTPGIALVDLGAHRLRGLVDATRVFGVRADGVAWPDRPLTMADATRGNLPHPLTEWFGPVDELRRHAADLGRRRLVTLTGPGGVGKTRLAIEMGALVADEFPDGAWIVELAPVVDRDSVHATVAATLGVLPQAGMSVLDSILEWLQGRRLLLVLDNCEHVLAPVVTLTSAVLRAEDAVTVLATSREPLGLAGERVVPVPPLQVPDAVALFCDRSAALDASMMFSPDDEATIGAICARLDGVPLAIELAAARSRSLGPADLLARLADRFRLLRGGGRTGLERHQTLRATVSWSYQLLEATEQALFDRLSVFAGGFDLAAAEAVCAFEPIDALDVVDLLGALVDKSLVIADRADGTTRYRLLETLRQYGEERLEERGETLVARERHLAHYLGAARRAYELWLSERYEDGAAVFNREWDNFRVAHATALANGDLERAEAVLDATYAPALHDQRSEFLDWAQWTLAGAKAAGRHTAATYGQAASFLFRLGNYDEAIETATAGLGASPDEPRGELLCLTYLHAALGAQQRPAERQDAATRLDALLAAGADPFVTAVAVTIAATTGADSARGHLDHLEDLARTTAAPPLQELAGLSRGMFLLSHTPPDPEGALVSFRGGVDAARRTASGPIAASNLYGLATCSVRLGLGTAEDACREAIAHCYEARHWSLVWGSIGAATVHLARSGEVEPAAVLHGYLDAHLARVPPYDRLRWEDTERLLAGPNGGRWHSEGAAMDRHEVVRYALECLSPRSEASPPATAERPGNANTAQSPA